MVVAYIFIPTNLARSLILQAHDCRDIVVTECDGTLGLCYLQKVVREDVEEEAKSKQRLWLDTDGSVRYRNQIPAEFEMHVVSARQAPKLCF